MKRLHSTKKGILIKATHLLEYLLYLKGERPPLSLSYLHTDILGQPAIDALLYQIEKCYKLLNQVFKYSGLHQFSYFHWVSYILILAE